MGVWGLGFGVGGWGLGPHPPPPNPQSPIPKSIYVSILFVKKSIIINKINK